MIASAVAVATALAVSAQPARPAARGKAPPARGRAPPARVAAARPRLDLSAAARPRHPPGRGTVVQVTSARAYLDAGSRDGLAPGAVVQLHRAGRRIGSCHVEMATDDHAACVGEGITAGDTFTVAEPPPPPPPYDLPQALPPGEASRRAALVSAARQGKVDFKQKEERPQVIWRGVEAQVGYTGWASSGGVPWNQERVDVAVRGAEVFKGMQLYLDLSALAIQHDQLPRFRPGADTQLYVREAALAARAPGSPLALSVGRVLPWFAPGATRFDGVQAGWRPSVGTEVGVYGGGVPDVETLVPTFERSTVGAYWLVERPGTDAFLRHEARLAFLHSPEGVNRLEAELLGQAYLGRTLSVSGDVRLGLGDQTAPGNLDAVRVDLASQPSPFSISASFRYLGLTSTDFAGPADLPSGGASRHGDLAAGWNVLETLTLSAVGGFAQDLVTGLDRGWIGPEVSLPRLRFLRGGLSAGWLEELGWASGRTVYLQLLTQPWDRLRLLARASYFQDERDVGDDDRELGGYLSAVADLTYWLSLRLSLLGRTSVATSASQPSFQGITGFAGLAARY